MACIKHMQHKVKVPMLRTSVKRRVGYAEEDGREPKRPSGRMEGILMTKEQA